MRKVSLITATGLMALLASLSFHAIATERETVALSVEGITGHTGDDEPGVLYILPWQPPTLPRRTRAELETGSEQLLEPKDPLTLERHRKFRETLNPSLDSTLSLQ